MEIVPVTRKEKFIKAAIEGVPLSIDAIPRIEMYLAKISGDNVDLPDPITRIEKYLAVIAGMDVVLPSPVTRVEKYLAKIAGMDVETPDPVTRIEMLLDEWVESSGGVLKTVSGAVVSVSDALKKAIISMVVSLEPIQSLNGYASPWPAGGGKNKFDVGAVVPFNNDVTVTKNGGSFTVANGNSYGAEMFCDADATKMRFAVTDGKYSISISEATTVAIGVYGSSDGTNYSWLANGIVVGNTSATFTVSGQTYVQFRASAPANGSATIKNFMFESGETVSAWTPYSNICPISGHDSVKVTRTGKNLIPTLDPADAVKYNGSGLTVTAYGNGIQVRGQSSGSGHAVGFALFPADPFIGQQITFSATISGDYPRAMLVYANLDLSNRTVAQYIDTSGNFTVTVPNTAAGKYICISLFSSTTVDSDDAVCQYTNLQLELGSTATAYEPYQGTSVEVALGQTVYGGELDVTTGVLTLDRAMVDLGTLDWTAGMIGQQVPVHYASLNDAKQTANGMNFGGLSEKYKSIRFNAVANALYQIALRDNNKLYVTGVESPTGKLVYELATPQTVQLTPTEIEMLLGENTVWSENGDITLTYMADGPADDVEALNILLGNRYVNLGEPDEATDKEALDILLGGR